MTIYYTTTTPQAHVIGRHVRTCMPSIQIVWVLDQQPVGGWIISVFFFNFFIFISFVFKHTTCRFRLPGNIQGFPHTKQYEHDPIPRTRNTNFLYIYIVVRIIQPLLCYYYFAYYTYSVLSAYYMYYRCCRCCYLGRYPSTAANHPSPPRLQKAYVPSTRFQEAERIIM